MFQNWQTSCFLGVSLECATLAHTVCLILMLCLPMQGQQIPWPGPEDSAALRQAANFPIQVGHL